MRRTIKAMAASEPARAIRSAIVIRKLRERMCRQRPEAHLDQRPDTGQNTDRIFLTAMNRYSTGSPRPFKRACDPLMAELVWRWDNEELVFCRRRRFGALQAVNWLLIFISVRPKRRPLVFLFRVMQIGAPSTRCWILPSVGHRVHHSW